MTTLTVIIATKDEVVNIGDCLSSVSFSDEIIVLDSGSTDGTVEIAKAVGARVIETDWPGYGPQQNRGIEAATCDWTFSLDADERITPALAQEIRAVIGQSQFDGFDVPRQSWFIARFLRHSGWWPDRTRRLVRRGNGRFTDQTVHANLRVDGNVGHLTHPIVHYSYRDLDSVIEKMNRYSSGSARDMYARGKRTTLLAAALHGIWAFLRTYVLKLGALDGAEGFMVSVANGQTSYYKHLKLRELLLNKPAQLVPVGKQ